MAEDIVDLLQIRIEKAKRELPPDTLNAIDSVDWKESLLQLRTTRGYTFEQLGELELETELVLSGLLSPKDYPRELERRMKISRANADELVNEMNDLVFKKIRAELIKNTERKKIFQDKTSEIKEEKVNTGILSSAGINIGGEVVKPDPHFNESFGQDADKKPEGREDMLKKIEKPELISAVNTGESTSDTKIHPILIQKLSSSFKTPVIKTEHSLDNISKTNVTTGTTTSPSSYPNKADPYRLSPDE